MAQRPESDGSPVYYEWASEQVQQVVTVNNRTVILNNKEPTLTEFTNFGLRYGQPLNFQEINYQFDGISQWIQHLDQRYSAGDLHRTTSTETEAQISERLGGTWTLLGSESIGGETVYLYEKQS